MTTWHHASEVAFQVEPDWVDRSEYSYVRGEFRFYVRRFGASSDARARADLALATFARNVPRHSIVERREIDAPGPGELVVHQMPGDPGAIEIFMYWAVGDRCWLCRTTGPLDAEAECRSIIDGFIETYEPVEGP